jgi:hypothetical protein
MDWADKSRSGALQIVATFHSRACHVFLRNYKSVPTPAAVQGALVLRILAASFGIVFCHTFYFHHFHNSSFHT